MDVKEVLEIIIYLHYILIVGNTNLILLFMRRIYGLVITLGLLSNTLYAQVMLDSSLLASYYFSGSFADSSGHGFDASDYGVYFATDRFGNPNSAAHFDGYSFLHLPALVRFQPLTSGSVSFWMRTTSYDRFFIFEQRIGAGVPDNLNFNISFNYPFPQYIHYTYPNYNGTPSAFTSFIVFTDPAINGDWHHFVFVKSTEDSTMSVYQDNVLIGYRPIMDVDFIVQGELIVGRTYDYDFFFNGDLDDVKIYNRVLNTTEIDSLYKEIVVVDIDSPDKTSLNIFPNPTKGKVFVQTSTEYNNIGIIEVYSETGRILKQFKDVSDIDISEFPTGNYLIVLTDNKGKRISTTVTKL